jgi:hypothetical protein
MQKIDFASGKADSVSTKEREEHGGEVYRAQQW